MATITGQQQGIDAVTTTLASEVVEALYPQWAVNGCDLPAAFAAVAENHHDPVIRHTAATAPLTPVLTAALEGVFWPRHRAERQALRG